MSDMKPILQLLVSMLLLAGCGGGGGDTGSNPTGGQQSQKSGTISLLLTDGPSEAIEHVVLHVTHVELGQADGRITHVPLTGGPRDVDVAELDDGQTHRLLDRSEVEAQHYEWMELGIDLDKSWIGTHQGGHHGMRLGDEDALRVHTPFDIRQDTNTEFVLDFDLRNGIHRGHDGRMGGSGYELQGGWRLMQADNTAGLSGTVDASLTDAYHPDCDPAPGGNWAYLFEGSGAQPDDYAYSEVDGHPGPIATDRIELNNATGVYQYNFRHIPAGTYRIAVTCAGEWDESGDDDYPTDPDGRFDFHAFSDPIEATTGEVREYNLR